MILKVKEPLASEYARLRRGLILFTYLHLAADPPLTRRAAREPASPRWRTRRFSSTTARCRCSRR